MLSEYCLLITIAYNYYTIYERAAHSPYMCANLFRNWQRIVTSLSEFQEQEQIKTITEIAEWHDDDIFIFFNSSFLLF